MFFNRSAAEWACTGNVGVQNLIQVGAKQADDKKKAEVRCTSANQL